MQYRMDKIVEAKITKYLDGDTIKVTLTNGFIITVRLLLIDCPEYKRLKIDQNMPPWFKVNYLILHIFIIKCEYSSYMADF